MAARAGQRIVDEFDMESTCAQALGLGVEIAGFDDGQSRTLPDQLSGQLTTARQALMKSSQEVLSMLQTYVEVATKMEAEVAELNIENHNLQEQLASMGKIVSNGETGGTGEALEDPTLTSSATSVPQSQLQVSEAWEAQPSRRDQLAAQAAALRSSPVKPRPLTGGPRADPAAAAVQQIDRQLSASKESAENCSGLEKEAALPKEGTMAATAKAHVAAVLPAPSAAAASDDAAALQRPSAPSVSAPLAWDDMTAQTLPGSTKGADWISNTVVAESRFTSKGNAVGQKELSAVVPTVASTSDERKMSKNKDSQPTEADDLEQRRRMRKGRITNRPILDDTEQMAPVQKPVAVFADAAAMKENIRMAICKVQYNVTDFYWDTGVAQSVARSPIFDNITLFIIGFNALWIAIDTDCNDADVISQAEPIFIIVENFFCAYFFFEWFVRFMSFRKKRDGLQDNWFIFDTMLAGTSVMETWVLQFLVVVSGGSGSNNGLNNASLLKLFRLVRLTRMARMARLLRAMPEMLILIKGMAVAMRSVIFTVCLLLCFIYVFAVAFVQMLGPRGAFAPSPTGQMYFNSVPEAMQNLLAFSGFPDQKDFTDDVADESLAMYILVMIFLLLSAVTVMNMLVGVLCEVVSVVSSVEKEQLLVGFVKQQLLGMLNNNNIDADNDGKISRVEFKALLDQPAAARALSEVGVDVIGLVDTTDFIFDGDQDLSFPEFMDVVLQLRGSNTATVKDIVDLRKVLSNEFNDLANKVASKVATEVSSAVAGKVEDEFDYLAVAAARQSLKAAV